MKSDRNIRNWGVCAGGVGAIHGLKLDALKNIYKFRSTKWGLQRWRGISKALITKTVHAPRHALARGLLWRKELPTTTAVQFWPLKYPTVI